MTLTELFQAHCKTTGLYGLYVQRRHELDHLESGLLDTTKGCPFLGFFPSPHNPHAQVIFNGEGFFFFDTSEELERHYDQVVGEDGPTASNPYTGPATWYGLTCGPDGNLITENT